MNWPQDPTLAVNVDIVDPLIFPFVGQPKLNGIRACWDGEHLISRQKKVWSPQKLPHIYEKLSQFSNKYPDIFLDGELYCHGMPMQEINARCAINSVTAHPDCHVIDFHAFDIICSDTTELRQTALCQIYKPWTAVCKITNEKEMEVWLNRFVEAGFEGLMMRALFCPYISGRTEALIKVKPWKYSRAVIIGYKEGLGKYKGTLGAIEVKDVHTNAKFFISGGLSDANREELWKRKRGDIMLTRYLDYKYRDLSNTRIPLQPQIVRL